MANKILIGLIIGLIIGLVAGGIVSYFIFNHRGFSRGNNFQFNLNETQINEINYFFDSNHTSVEITAYCEQNSFNCMYYCRNINSSSEICKNLNTMPRSGNQFI